MTQLPHSWVFFKGHGNTDSKRYIPLKKKKRYIPMFTAIKKEILPSVTRMDSEGIMLSEVSQRQILYGFTHMWNLKQTKKKSNKQNKTKTNSQIEQNSGYQWERWFRGKTGEGGQLYGVCVCTRAHTQSYPTLWDPKGCSLPGSTEFFRQEYRSKLLFPTPGYLPDPGMEPTSHESPTLAGRFFTTESPR